MSTRPGNKTPHPGVVEKKTIRRKGKDGKTVRELDREAKKNKEAEKEQKVRDLERLEVEQAANLANLAAVTPIHPTRTLRGGKQVSTATTVKKARKRQVTMSHKQPQAQGQVAGAEGGTMDVDENNAEVGAPAYIGPGPLPADPTRANPEFVGPTAGGGSKNVGHNAVASGKKRGHMTPAIQEVVEVSRGCCQFHKNN